MIYSDAFIFSNLIDEKSYLMDFIAFSSRLVELTFFSPLVLIGYLNFIFCELTVSSFCAFSTGLFFLLNCRLSLYILDTKPLLYVLQISSPSLSLAFNFVYSFFYHAEVLNFDVIQFIRLFFYQLGFLCFVEILSYPQVINILSYFFPKRLKALLFFSYISVFIV